MGGSGMNEAPDYRYVRSTDGTSIAYQVMGRGSIDLVYIGGEAIDLWDDPGFLRFTRRLGNFARMIWVHQRGWDQPVGTPARQYHIPDEEEERWSLSGESILRRGY